MVKAKSKKVKQGNRPPKFKRKQDWKQPKLAKTRLYSTTNIFDIEGKPCVKITVWDDYDHQLKKVFTPDMFHETDDRFIEKWLDQFIEIDEVKNMFFGDGPKIGPNAIVTEFFLWELVRSLCKHNKWRGQLWMVKQNVDFRAWDWSEGSYQLTYKF